MFLFSFNNGVFLIYTVFMGPCWRRCKIRNMLEMSFLSLLVYQFCFDLIFTSCFPQIRMEVALCAASPYPARDKKSFRKYSRAFTVLLSLCWAANIRVPNPSQVATSSVKQNDKGFIIPFALNPHYHWCMKLCYFNMVVYIVHVPCRNVNSTVSKVSMVYLFFIY